MNTDDVLVILAGIVAVAAVNWWFFLAGREPKAKRDARRN